jgi:hypothetical protein
VKNIMKYDDPLDNKFWKFVLMTDTQFTLHTKFFIWCTIGSIATFFIFLFMLGSLGKAIIVGLGYFFTLFLYSLMMKHEGMFDDDYFEVEDE